MTIDRAKQLYIGAGGPSNHSPDEWASIHREIEAIVAAKSDRAAGRIITWWECWNGRHTATAFARMVRELNNKPVDARQDGGL